MKRVYTLLMLCSNKETLEEKVVGYLLDREQTVKGVRKLLSVDGAPASIQGIYKALRILVSQEIVIKRGNLYALSEEWRSRAVDFLERGASRIDLAGGERISLDLKSLVHLDQQWKNIVLPLQSSWPDQPAFLYNPHEIWIHLSDSRKESEKEYFSLFKKRKMHAFHAIGGETVHDRAMKKELQNEYMQISLGALGVPKTDHLLIFGDYVVTTRLSVRLASEIESCYQESADVFSLESRLQKIGIEKKNIKLIVERDGEKAKRLRKKLSKNFFVPNELVEKFGLY